MSVLKRVTRLQQRINSSSSALPISVRFATEGGQFMLSVTAISIDEKRVVIRDSRFDAQVVFPIAELIEVVPFRDANGKAVFLHDFASEDFLPAEIAKEKEEQMFRKPVVVFGEYIGVSIRSAA